MDRRRRYVDKATECILAAEDVRDRAERVKLLQLAQQWMRLAEHVASRLDESTPHRRADRDSARGLEPDS